MSENNGKLSSFNTEHVAAAVVIASLVLLFLIRRGFRGISVGGVSVGIG